MGETVTMAKTLTIFLAADVSKLNRQLKGAQSDLNIFSNGIGGVAGKLSNLMGPALIGAAAAAGAFAVKLGVDGVKAALDDAASIDKLAQTLENLNLAHQLPEVENAISKFERTLGIADTDLRPAYDRLARSIGNTEEATRVLGIALDVSAGSGKSLDSVVQALGKAYDGNITGLSRLGAGIDAATLRTGDLDLITRKLSDTFRGQAQTSAETLQGQMQVLKTAVDNVAESFGRGFLDALGDTKDGTTDLVGALQDLEPEMEKIGRTTGDVTTGLVKGAAAALNFNDEVGNLTDRAIARFSISLSRNADALGLISDEMGAADEAAYQLYLTENNLIPVTESFTSATVQSAIALGTTTKRLADLNAVAESTYRNFIRFAEASANSTKTTADQAERTATATTRVTEYTASVSSAGSAVQKLQKDVEESSPAYDAATKRVQLSTDALDAETKALQDATQKRKDYVNSLVGQITSGFDLGSGFAMKDGQVDGAAWVAGVEGQLAQTEWFGNVLEAVKRSDATNGEALAQYLAKQGIDKGAVWGQALLDQGLVPTMAAKLQQAVDSATLVATAMADPFTEAGDMAALNTIDGLSKTLNDEKETLKKIGKNIGKPIGARIKEEIAQAVAEAITAAAAARTAALAEITAREAAQNAIAVEQATAQSLARIIRNSDNRAGRNVQPVLA
jgi:hypothetical protein